MSPVEKITVIIMLICGCMAQNGVSISCYVCQSYDGSNPECDDQFHTNRTNTYLQAPCMTGRKEREGEFPATACIKLAGTFVESKKKITMRTCALDSGSLTVDTELVRMSHCGSFIFEKEYVSGCLSSCFTDGCNSAPRTDTASPGLWLITTAALLAAAALVR